MSLLEPSPPVRVSLRGPEAARQARRAVEELLVAEGVSQQRIYDAVLIASELVANAIQVIGHCTFAAHLGDDDTLRLEIADTSSHMPRMPERDVARVGGHGLRIVQQLCSRWGVVDHGDAKTVWVEMNLDR